MDQPANSTGGTHRNDSVSLTRSAKSWAQRLDAAGSENFRGRWSREHWMLASMFATMGAFVVAIVPGFTNALHIPKASHATFALSLPALPKSAAPAPIDSWQIVRVHKGQTIESLFADFNLSPTDVHLVLAQPVIHLHHLPADRQLRHFTAVIPAIPRIDPVRRLPRNQPLIDRPLHESRSRIPGPKRPIAIKHRHRRRQLMHSTMKLFSTRIPPQYLFHDRSQLFCAAARTRNITSESIYST